MITPVLIPADPTKPIQLATVDDPTDPASFAAAIGCRYIERVTTLLTATHSLVIVVDEEGVYADPQVHNKRASMLVGPLAHLVGDALLVREDSTDSWCAPVDPAATVRMVSYLTEPHPDVPRLTLHLIGDPETWGVRLDGVRVGWVQLHERGWWTVWGTRSGRTVDGDRAAAVAALLALEGADPGLAATAVEVAL